MSVPPDYYQRRLATEEYRRSRVARARVVAHLCEPWLSEARRSADLGSGTGIIKKQLETITHKPIIGIEVDRSYISSPERTIQADILCLPLASNGLEFVLLNHVYEHVQDPEALFREAYRVLAPGGRAYVAAGSRWAIVEPHYRLPLLSWLPRAAAGAYLRLMGRGRAYAGVKFLSYAPLRRMMEEAGFRVHDITERAIDELIEAVWGARWGRAWRGVKTVPAGIRGLFLRRLSPQWFFLLEKPATEEGVSSTGIRRIDEGTEQETEGA